MKNGTPEEVAAEVRGLIDQGAPLSNFSIDTVGLTYGTPDENVRIARQTAAEYGKIGVDKAAATQEKRVFSLARRPAETLPETLVSSASKTVTMGPSQPLVIIGERINPTGRKRLAQSIQKGDMHIVRSEALKQVENGAHMLDVNVGLSGIDEPKILREAIVAIQKVTDVPLCIDSAVPEALKVALEVYKGKALVNSVNGEKGKLQHILPLVKEHGAAVIGLTMDENGIPKEAEKRLQIARRILEKAEQMGIPRQDVIIDPLAMAVSADHEAALETIRALQMIHDELGVNLTLGLSNISFGLPDRDFVNAVFLAMAATSGLSCVIVGPTVPQIRKTLLAVEMLLGKDQYCSNYFSAFKQEESAQGRAFPEKKDDLDLLKEAIIFGRRKEAVALTKEALDKGVDPQGLINEYLIPALNTVGEKFEQRKIFIPEMMMAAKSMQGCMDLIKPFLKKDSDEVLGTVVLGTVFGDLHDIGKNLVKLLLETSGFRVVDLGENVPPQKFVDAARERGAQVIGLSSLLTTGDPYVKETIETIRQSDIGKEVKVICGGAALTPRFVEACGADAYAKDAAEGVKKVKQLLGISGS